MLWAKLMQALIMDNLKALPFPAVAINTPLWAVTPAVLVRNHLVQGPVQAVPFALDPGEQQVARRMFSLRQSGGKSVVTLAFPPYPLPLWELR